MTTKVGKLAPYLDGIPIVASASERAVLFPSPDVRQRVDNLTSGNIERWNGTSWVTAGAGPITVVAGNDGGTDWGTMLAASIAALPVSGAGIVDARYLNGAQSLSASLTVSRNATTILLADDLALAMGAFQLTAPGGIIGLQIISGLAWGASTDAGVGAYYPTGLQFVYTGTVGPIQIGDAVTQSRNVRFVGVGVDISGAGDSAVGINLKQVIYFDLARPCVYGKGGDKSQRGIKLDGAGSFFTGWGTINQPIVNRCNTGIYGTGSGVHAANSVTVSGGSIRCDGGTHGTAGFTISPADSWVITGTDIAGYADGVYAQTASTGHFIAVRTEAIDTAAIYLDTAVSNTFAFATTGTITDLGTNNTTLTGGAMRVGGTQSVVGNMGVGGSLSVTTSNTALSQVVASAANAATWTRGTASELVTLATGAAFTDTSANLLPANSIIESVVARITTTITTAVNWKLGDATTTGRFTAANSTMTAGTTDIGLLHQAGGIATDAAGAVQVAAAKVRITLNANPGAGVIRVTVFYRSFVAPTS